MASVVVDIFDRYDIQNSIKKTERDRRSKSVFTAKIYEVIGQSLYLAGLFSNPETVKMLNQNGMLHCSCLVSTQEEADTRIILHALYSDKLYQENNVQGRIVVKSPDTDVLVHLVHYFLSMKNTSELWFQTGLIPSTKDCRRYIPVHELCKSLSSVVCEILPAAHALTGCDTTSSFFGIGKKSMLKALKETPNQFSDLSRIEFSDIDDSVDLNRKLISRLIMIVFMFLFCINYYICVYTNITRDCIVLQQLML